MNSGHRLGSAAKDLKAAHLRGVEHNVATPFNALSATLLFGSMGQQKLEAQQRNRTILARRPSAFDRDLKESEVPTSLGIWKARTGVRR
ncbi:hypothetical protein ABIC21_002115 [Pseudarthrobacter sp. PvP090]